MMQKCFILCFISTVVPVYDVRLNNIALMDSGADHVINTDLEILITGDGQAVYGNDLWKVSMWTSASSDGAGQKEGFVSQVLILFPRAQL